MAVETSLTTGAASRPPQDWHAIDWQKVMENVRRLHARIVKAEKRFVRNEAATVTGRWKVLSGMRRKAPVRF